MNNVQTNISFKECCAITIDTIKRKPYAPFAILVSVVSAVALSLLLIFSTPLVAPILIIAVIALNLVGTFLWSTIFFQEIKNTLFIQFKKNHTIDKVHDKHVVLILEAEYDHNGAFNHDQRKEFYKIQNSYYAIAFKKISNLQDISKSIKEMYDGNNQIQALWIRAHGTPRNMCLGNDDENENFLTIKNVVKLEKQLKLIDPKGYIILDSCSTGGKNKNSLNIAETIAKLAPGRTIIAPSENLEASLIKIDKRNPLKVKMRARTTVRSYFSEFTKEAEKIKLRIRNGKSIFKLPTYDIIKIYQYSG